jgi:hypothetical protein
MYQILMYQILIFEFTPSKLFFIHPLPIPGIVSTGIIFAFTYTCIHFVYRIHPPAPFSYYLLSPDWYNTPPQARPVPPLCSLIL